MLLFNKPRTRLLAHKQRRRCIKHFGGVAEGQSVSDAQPVPSHENISPPNSVSSKFKDKQTELPSTSRMKRGWETFFNLQLDDSRKTQTQWTRGTKAKMSLGLLAGSLPVYRWMKYLNRLHEVTIKKCICKLFWRCDFSWIKPNLSIVQA